MSNQTIVSAYGRYAHSSGCRIVSWQEFLDGEMNELVRDTMGTEIFNEVIAELHSIS